MARPVFDAVSESHTGTTGSANEASFTWNHVPAGTPRGITIAVVTIGATGLATSVTYGGVEVPAVPGGSASDTATEPGTVQTFHLGQNVPAGTQAVVVNRTNNATVMYAVAVSVTATTITGIVGTPALVQENGTYAEQAVDSGAYDALRLAFGYSGGANVLAGGANSTSLGTSGQIDFGAFTFTSARETTGGTGSRSVGFSFGTSDDRAGVHLAVAEIIPAAVTDDFNRADGGLGANWTVDQGTFAIVSNEAQSTEDTSFNRARYTAAQMATDDHYAEADVRIRSGITSNFGGPSIRQASSAHTLYTLHWRDQTSVGLLLQKVVAGVETELGTVTGNFAGPLRLKVQAIGSTIKGFRDGVEIFSVTDTDIPTGKYCGIWTWRLRGTWDNFAAGDIVVDVTAPVISAPSVGSITHQGGVPQVTTDEGNGTAYYVAVPDGDSPSVAQIKAGQNSSGGNALFARSKAVAAAGVVTMPEILALLPSVAYDVWFVHTDAATNNSNAVKADFSTIAQPDVARGKFFEKAIVNNGAYSNKINNVKLNVTVTDPDTIPLDIEGYFDGQGDGTGNPTTGNVWKFRAFAAKVGTYTFDWEFSDLGLSGSGSFVVTATGAVLGLVKEYAGNDRWLERDGAPHYLKSYHLHVAGLPTQDLAWMITNVYTPIKNRGYNHIQVVGYLPTAWWDEVFLDGGAPASLGPLYTGNTPSTTMRIDVWKRMESHLQWMLDNNISVHFFMGFNGNDAGLFPSDWKFGDFTTAEQQEFVRYCVARLGAYASISSWDYTWETDDTTTSYGDQIANARIWADHMITYDKYNHLRGYHDVNAVTNTYYAEPRWTLGTSGDEGTPLTAAAHDTPLNVYADGALPQFNVEGNGLWRSKVDATEDTVRQCAWAAVTAAGHFSWTDSRRKASEGGGVLASLIFAWTNAANAIDYLYDIITGEVTWYTMTPQDGLLSGFTGICYCLAEIGAQYLVYREGNGAFDLTIQSGMGWTGEWVDTKTNDRSSAGSGTGTGSPLTFTPPATPTTDWVLKVTLVPETPVARTAVLNLESPATMAAIRAMALEALSSPAAARVLWLEALVSPAATRALSIESLRAASAARTSVLEALAAVAVAHGLSLEALQQLASSRTELLESLVSVAQAVAENIEAVHGLAADRTLNLEALSSEVAVSMTAALLFETLTYLAADRAANLEASAGVTQTSAPPFESLIVVAQPVAAGIEALGTIAAARGISLEALQQLASSRTALLESLLSVAQARAANVEALLGAASGRTLNLESLGELLIALTAAIPLESLSDSRATRVLSLETLEPAARTVALTLEALTHVAQTRAGVFEAVALVRIAPAPALEALTPVDRTTPFNLEGLATVRGTTTLPVEVLQAIAAATGIPFEVLQGGVVNIIVNVVERIAYFQVSLPNEVRFADTQTETVRVAQKRTIEADF